MARKRKGTGSLDSSPSKYKQIAIDYAKAAIADRNHQSHGKRIRKAAKRFLSDLKRAESQKCPFYWDDWHANDACEFIEMLPHVEGAWDSPYIVLDPAQVFFVAQLFGFRKRSDGTRRFTSALFAVARKAGKSTLAAAILLYCQCREDEMGAQVISAATTFPQASIIFGVAKRMVERSPDLKEYFGLETFAKSIVRMELGASFKPIHAKASTQDGLNPSHVGLDEIHAHKTSDLLNVLTSAAGARRSPLWLYTTTEGYENPGPWGEIRQFANQVLDGVFGDEADHFLVVFFAVDDEDDDFDESKWVKANPLIRSNPHLLTAIRKEATEAKAMPSKLAEFQIKRLNRRASVAGGWIDLSAWRKCSGPVPLDELREVPCFGGLDLASTRDLCSFRLRWVLDGVMYTWGRRWVPESAVAHRTMRGTVPYASWVASGYLEQTPGDVTDYAVIEAAINEAREQFNIVAIGYDAWNASDVVGRLKDAGANMIQVIQGPKTFHPAMKALEVAYAKGNLRHGGDPVLTWCASNIVARRDVNLNMAPDRTRSSDKIDDMVALLMSIAVEQNMEKEEEPEYQIFFV